MSKSLKKQQLAKIFGTCSKCKEPNTHLAWCNTCDTLALVNNFETWTSGNLHIDEFIQSTQRDAQNYHDYLEWIPFERFSNIEYLGKGGFGTVYSAKWEDGMRIGTWDKTLKLPSRDLKTRSEPITVALKKLNKSREITKEFLNELQIQYKCFDNVNCNQALKFYGVTRNLEEEYAMVMQFAENGDLRHFIQQKSEKLRWRTRMRILHGLIGDISEIHKKGFVHRDIHPGNILISRKGCVTFVADLGLARPVHSPSSNDKGAYGVIPYMAPEVLQGQPHTPSSDIYSVGMVMWELSSGNPPFYDRDHNDHLQLDICDNGLRPDPISGTPQCWIDLMTRCWHSDPAQRPTAVEILKKAQEWRQDVKQEDETDVNRQFKEADRIFKSSSQKASLIVKHPGAVYTSRFVPYYLIEQCEDIPL